MIDDLDRSIQQLLRYELPAALFDQISVSFAAPDNEFPPAAVTLPAIDVFLYDIRENTDLRDTRWDVNREPFGTATRSRGLSRVDCSYFITAWPSDTSTTPAFDEHRLLSEVMQVLLRHRTLPEPVLVGTLRVPGAPLPTSVLQPSRLQSVAEFWQALGGKPKAALNYTVTITVPVDRPEPTEPLVRDKMIIIETTK
jgi:hypothetical protein